MYIKFFSSVFSMIKKKYTGCYGLGKLGRYPSDIYITLYALNYWAELLTCGSMLRIPLLQLERLQAGSPQKCTCPLPRKASRYTCKYRESVQPYRRHITLTSIAVKTTSRIQHKESIAKDGVIHTEQI